MRVEPMHDAPRDASALASLLEQGWPNFIIADTVAEAHLPEVRYRFADLELLVIDGEQYVGAGWAVPIRWDGVVEDLPHGYSDSLRRALSADDRGSPNTLVVCAAQVDAAHQGRGVATELLQAFGTLTSSRHLQRLIVPLRPTRKHLYPLTPIEEYVTWTRPDGSPFDPWLRTHWRMGARVLATAPRSQVMTGTIEQWEQWTGLTLPSPGAYVIPDGLSALTIDSAGQGTYVEPNIWVDHPREDLIREPRNWTTSSRPG